MELREIIESIKPGIDVDSGEFISEGILDSFDIIRLISAISDEYDIKVGAKEVIPENFESLDAIQAMIDRLLDE